MDQQPLSARSRPLMSVPLNSYSMEEHGCHLVSCGCMDLAHLGPSRLVPEVSSRMVAWARRGPPPFHRDTLVSFALSDIKAQSERTDRRVATQLECSAFWIPRGSCSSPMENLNALYASALTTRFAFGLLFASFVVLAYSNSAQWL